ncbi:hypothetical protein AQS8620_02768 [Aquimixticola soesokkakensis]|uniref:Uncharacterized protein n=1 Tax=Aquimixticola soesokkakensis TaxID=1519096 RepID=A0A1Y5TD41_9RHOB|nr:DUF6638 family protein [Aquimixticola soesokkakensis]SLN60978.1 hypothetical protein AQS8620_02768 [Aquimixticola soesokkakensis]
MRLLIERGLMFGGLVVVDSPALIERYNRALERLTGRRTQLSDFHVDLAGYSPEIADELEAPDYLDRAGANRRFILLSTAQKHSPLLREKFSVMRDLIRRFITDNEAALFALTARDAVAGEVVSSVVDLSSPARVLDIHSLSIEADTTNSRVADARKLEARITEFRTREDGWYDDVLIAQMIDLARSTGDVTRNPVTLSRLDAREESFWTSHFGGLYVLRDVAAPAVIRGGAALEGDLPLPVIDIAARNAVARFLTDNSLVEPVVRARGTQGATFLAQKLDFMVVEAASAAGVSIGTGTPRALRDAAQQLGPALPEAAQGLGALLRWSQEGGSWPALSSQHPAYFYTLRAAAEHPLAPLVNRLLAELCPADPVQAFLWNKPQFYATYARWAEPMQAFVADWLAAQYLPDKAAFRTARFVTRDAALSGASAAVRRVAKAAPVPPPPPLPSASPTKPLASPWGSAKPTGAPKAPDIIDLVGPWGAVQRREE